MKNIKLIALAILTSLLATSCIVDDEVETSFSTSPRVVGYTTTFESLGYFSDLGTIRHDFPVSLIGGADGTASSQDLVIDFEIIDAESNAVEGLEYDFVGSKTVVIPAGSTFGLIPVDVYTGSFNPTAKTNVKIRLTSVTSGGAVISTLNETFDIIFVGCQSVVDTFSYNCLVTRDDGASWNHGTQSITLTATNEFKTVTTGGWGAGTIAPDQGFTFVDICGDITVPLQGLAQGYYSNEVTGLTNDGTDGEVLPNGDIRIVYQIDFASGPAVYTNYYTKL